MRITNNVPALLTHINLRQNDRLMSRHMNRLSTGLRINSAREDAAGMAIANKLTFQLTGLERASDNSQHGISVVQTAEGALDAVHAMLQRVRELAVQAANDTNVEADRMAIQREINELTDEITAIAARSEFNTIKLLNGEASRVTTNWVNTDLGATVLTRILANTMFVSEGVPPGTLRYDIISPALPAVVEGAAAISMTATAASTGRLLINGIGIDVNEGDTVRSIWDSILYISDYAGVIPTLPIPAASPGGPQNLLFTSIRNGSHEEIRLEGSADLWYDLFGIYLPPSSYAIEETFAGPIAGFPDLPLANAPGFDPTQPAGPGNEQFAPPWDSTNTVGYNGIITIMAGDDEIGWPISVSEDMTMLDLFNAIRDAGNVNRQVNRDTGVTSWEVRIDEDTGAWSIEAGHYTMNPATGQYDLWVPNANQEIVITADSHDTLRTQPNGEPIEIDIWGFLLGTPFVAPEPGSDAGRGSTPAPSANRLPAGTEFVNGVPQPPPNGADVVVENVRMYDRNNVLITDFNRSLSVTTSGNRVNIRSAQGHIIELNLHIPETAYREGSLHEVDTSLDAENVFDNAIQMELRIEAFGGLRVQIGPSYNQFMDLQIPRINSETLGLVDYRGGRMVRLLELTTQRGASRAITQANDAIERVSRVRSRLGAYQNRLEHTINNLDNAAVNTAAARSRIQDTDMAREMTLLSKRNVMYQAGLAILGQANQRPQMILQLLQ